MISGGISVTGQIDGENGYSIVVVQLFRRYTPTQAAPIPALPTGSLTYTFSTGILSGIAERFNGWSQQIPSATADSRLYVTQATISSRDATIDIAPSDWSTPVEYVADGMGQVQAFKAFDADPGSDKPTKTTDITAQTTDFGNDWKKTPEKPTIRDIYVDDTGLNTNIGGMTVWADMISTDPNYSLFGKGWRIAKGNKTSASDSKYVVDRIKFTPLTDSEVFRLQIAASAEMGYDGVLVGNLNEAATISTNWSEAGKSTKGKTKNAIIDVTALVTDKANQECFIDIIFKKDATTYSNDDCGYYKLTTRAGKIYSSLATIENNTVVGDWSPATQWEGNEGPEGDGIVSVERTYAISNVNTTASDTTEPAHQGSWSATSPAVTDQYPYLWAREVVTYKFASATTKYYCIGSRGDNGVDAQDVEWAFIRSKTATAPHIYQDDSYVDTNGKNYTYDDHLPQVSGSENIELNNGHYQCTDSPKGVDSTWKYEWEIKRTKGSATSNGRRSWNYYQGAMTLHSNYAESAFIIDLSNNNDQFGTDSDSKVLVQQKRSTTVALYDGATKQSLTNLSVSLKYEDGTSVPSDVATYTAQTGTGVVEITIKQNNTANPHTEIQALITATCAIGSKNATFPIRKLMGGAPGLNPVIYQLAPTQKTFSFLRSDSNELSPSSRSTNINVARTEGNTTTILSTAQADIDFDWGFDESTVQGTAVPVGTQISITAAQAAIHYQVWVELSTGDRETLPIVKDGVNGELYVIDTNIDSITIPSNSVSVTKDVTGQFYKLAGSNKASHTCAFIMWKRSKTGTYTRIVNAASANSFNLSGLQVTNDTDALVAVMQTTLTNDPTVYIAKKEIAVICDGATGATGRMFNLLGVWDSNVNYGRTDMLIPLVWRDSNTQDPATGNFGNYWYLSADSSQGDDPNTDGGAHWTKAESFGFVITQGIFAQFANFGSAVITGDWMISGNGKIDGVDVTVNQLLTGKTVDANSSEWNTRAYTLFDGQNPRATSISILYGKNKDLPAGGTHALHIGNVTLSAGDTYSIRLYGHANYSSATPHVFVKIRRNGVGATDVLALDAQVSSHNQRAFFRVSEDGEYSVDIYETEHPSEPGTGNTYSGATIDFIEVAKIAFAPVYAVDLLAGGSIQRDMMTSGFIRKDKTVINMLNVDYYVYGQYDNRLVLERCGSFIELKDSVTVQFWPFVLCNQYRSLENVELTEEEKDYIRSLVGTKILLYLRDDSSIMDHFIVTNGWFTINGYTQHREVKIDGVTQPEPGSGSGSVDVIGTFLYRVTYERYLNPRSGDYENHYVWEFRSLQAGQFAEIECVTDVDEDGYEIVCWRVNSVGNIV